MTDNCKHVSKIKTSIQLGILSPERWHCNVCQTTECVWACLSCNNFACGRYISEHALQHFQQSNHPLCIEVNEKFVFCYMCDDFVLNDNAPGDIKLLRMALDAVTTQDFCELSRQKRGRRILRYHVRDAKRNRERLLKADDVHTAVVRHRISRLSWVLRSWWSHYAEIKCIADANRTTHGKSPPLGHSPAFTGLRNLGNTCYMNSILQVLRHTAAFANFVMNHTLGEIAPQCRKRCLESLTSTTGSEIHLPCKRPAIPSRSESETIICSHSISASLVSAATVSKAQLNKHDSPFESITSKVGASPGLNGGQCLKFCNHKEQSTLSAMTYGVESRPANTPFLYDELHNLFKLLWSGQRAVVSSSSLLYAVWSTLPNFKGYKQQDAQEFLSLLLDRLQTELHGAPIDYSITTHDFISRAFKGYSVSHIRCSSCQLITCTEEPIYELSLPLPPSCYTGDCSGCDLVDLLRQFVGPNPIDGASYACQKCSELGPNLDNGQMSYKALDLEHYNYASENSSCPVDKFVSITLSRLNCIGNLQSTYTGFTTPSEFTETSSSLSEIALSASPSLASVDDLDDKAFALHKLSDTANQSCDKYHVLPNTTDASKHSATTTASDGGACLTHATQTIKMSRLPRVLRLHIKRFRWLGRQREKLACHVSFPLILDMNEFMLNDSDREQCSRSHPQDGSTAVSTGLSIHHSNIHLSAGHHNDELLRTTTNGNRTNSDCSFVVCKNLYHLTGVVVHHGRGFQSGHYTAYCLNDQPECWLHCNDANVTSCDFTEVANAQAYLLFYSELIPKSPIPNWLQMSNNKSVDACTQKSHPVSKDLKDAGLVKTGSGSENSKCTLGPVRAELVPNNSDQIQSGS